MFEVEKLSIIKLQIISSFIWNIFIFFFNKNSPIIFSIITILILLNFGLWPSKFVYQFSLVLIYVLINCYFMSLTYRNRSVTMFLLRKELEKKINLKNNEIISFFDELSYKDNENEVKTLWVDFKERIKENILKNYHFRFSYFLITINRLKPFSLLNIFLLFFILFNYKLFSLASINKSIFGKNTIENIGIFSTNVWIYPPNEQKKDILFFENFSDTNENIERKLLLIKGSKILVNVYSLFEKDVILKFTQNGISKNIKPISSYEKTITYEEILDEGHYEILIKGKTFQKISIKFDREPLIKFEKYPKILNDTFLEFSLNILDENNNTTLLNIREVSNLKKLGSFEKNTFENIKRISKQDGYNIRLIPKKTKNGKLFYEFYRNLDFLPFSGEVNLTIKSTDKNNNFSSSEIIPIEISSRVFYNKLANQIINARQTFYKDENLRQLIKKLKNFKNNLENEYFFIYERLTNLISYLQQKQINLDQKIQKAYIETWNIAVKLEEINLDFLANEIAQTKKKLEELIQSEADEKQIEKLLNKLEELIEKYERYSGTKSEDQKYSNFMEQNEKSKSIKERTQEILDKIDQLIGENRQSNIETKEVLNKLESIVKHQKKLIEETFVYINNDTGQYMQSSRQKKIYEEFIKIKTKLIKYLHDRGKILESINESFIESERKLSQLKQEESIVHQRNILKDIEEIIRNIKENSRQINDKRKSDLQESNEEMQFNIPIIFETSSFDSIIAEIKRLANENTDNDREKEYLRKLLPKF